MSNATLKHLASKAEAHIRALVESIDKAHHDKNAAAIVAPYAQAVVVCDLAPPLSHRGMDLQAKQAWLDTWDGPVDREWRLCLLSWLLSAWRNPEGRRQTDQFLDARNGVHASRWGRLANRPRAYLRALLYGWELAARI